MSIPARIAKFIVDNPVVYASIGGGADVKTPPVDWPLHSSLVIARVFHNEGVGMWWLLCLTRASLIVWVPACYAYDQETL